MRPTHTMQIDPATVERVLQITDTFSLDRDAVVVPLKSHHPRGNVTILPDGKLILHPPIDASELEGWVAALPGVLASLDLRKTRKAS